jgi:hypothetical protein
VQVEIQIGSLSILPVPISKLALLIQFSDTVSVLPIPISNQKEFLFCLCQKRNGFVFEIILS